MSWLSASVPATLALWLCVGAPALAADPPRLRSIHPPAWNGQLLFELSDGQRLSGAHPDLTRLLKAHDVTARPAVELDEGRLDRIRRRAQAECACALPDLGRTYRIQWPGDATTAQSFLEAVVTVEGVVRAYPGSRISVPGDIAPTTPDFSAEQGYRGPAPEGLDSDFINTLPGGRGDHVTFVDMEYDWFLDHEDLQHCAQGGYAIPVPDPWDYEPYADHGTAVLSIIAADDDAYGVTGMAPDARCGWVPAFFGLSDDSISEGILITAELLSPGDVILLELQAAGPEYNPEYELGYAPVSWDPLVFDAIQTATAAGIIVVQAAGNGSVDLDDAIYEDQFDRSQRDDGSIMVGAGEHNTRERAWFSNQGERLDVQAWGTAVYSAGYGDLFGGDDVLQGYTSDFGGTSSASAITTGSVVALQSAYEQAVSIPLMPGPMRTLLVETGSPQQGNTDQHIGPQPDLRAAWETVFPPPEERVRACGCATTTPAGVGWLGWWGVGIWWGRRRHTTADTDRGHDAPT